MPASYPSAVKSFSTKTDGAGQTIYAAHVNDAQDEIVAVETNLLQTWTSYTPTWTASSVNPAIGDGTLAGIYHQVGKLLHFSITVTMGASTTYGTGTWRFALPTTVSAVTASVVMLDGGATFYTGAVTLVSGTTLQVITDVASAGVTPTHPITWATTDSLQINGWAVVS